MISQLKDRFSKLLSTNGKNSAHAAPELDPKLIRAYHKSRINKPHDSICNAPFTNMYFGHRGRVSACCFNRTHLLGSYPEMTVKEIWKSSKAEELRELLRKDDLRSGCESCEVLIRNGNHDGVVAKNYDVLPIHPEYPTKLEFELSNTCNLECTMCFGEFSSSIRKNREGKEPIPETYDDDFIEQLEEFIPHLESARFFGGEPFLIDIYYPIWDLIVGLNPDCQIVVQTNATILNNKVKELLDKGNFKINVSIDSFEEETYESIRVNANFRRVMKNIEYFHDYCVSRNTNLGISFCPIPENVHELPNVIEFCNQKNAFVYFNTVWHPKEFCLAHMSSQDLKTLHKSLKPAKFPDKSDVEKSNLHHYQDFVYQIGEWQKLARRRENKQEDDAIEQQKLKEEETKTLERTSSAELKEEFLRKIEQSLLEDELGEDRSAQFLSKTDKVLGRFPEDMKFKRTLSRLNRDPNAKSMINILESEDESQIYARVNAMYEESDE